MKRIILILALLCVRFSFGQQIERKTEFLKTKKLLKTDDGFNYFGKLNFNFQNEAPFYSFAVISKSLGNKDLKLYYNAGNGWQKVERSDDLTEPGNPDFYSELYFVNKDTQVIEFKSEKDLSGIELKVYMVNPGKSENMSVKSLKKEEGIDRPPYINRKGWGCPAPEDVPASDTRYKLTDVTHLIVHHSAGQTFSSDFKAVVRSYWDYHVNTRGWTDIGYNWLVDPNGVLYKGRAWIDGKENVQGAHNSGYNGNTAGICYIGNYEDYQPVQKGLDMLSNILAYLCDKYQINPLGTSYHASLGRVNDNIDGHGLSGGGTSCPGKNIISILGNIRAETKSKMIDVTATPFVISYSPEYDSINTYVPIKVKFSHPMAQQTVEDNFSISPSIEGKFVWNSEITEFEFIPNTDFQLNTEYTITIGANSLSRWIVPMGNDYTFKIHTKKFNHLSLISSYPEHNQTDIPVDIKAELIFDENIDANSMGNFEFLDNNFNPVAIIPDITSLSQRSIRFYPSNSLKHNSIYYIILGEELKDIYGNAYLKNDTIKFRTKMPSNVHDANLPEKFLLNQNYPNPFNPSTNISFNIIESGIYSLEIYDILGNLIDIIFSKKYFSNGNYNYIWNSISKNKSLPSGVYLYRLSGQEFSSSKKMVLIK